MSRPIETRFLITGTLIAETPIHVGGIEGNPATDMALSVDGQGRLYIPGTSLAGPLRHWLIEVFGARAVEKFWGRIPPKGSDVKSQASYVTIDDSVIEPSVSTEIRDGVGIDREYGSAAYGIKFDREILPKGTKIGLRIAYDRPLNNAGAAELRAALEALGRGDIRLGAAKTRGLGKVDLYGVWTVEQFDLHTRSGVLALLHRPGNGSAKGYGKGKLELLSKTAASGTATPKITITIKWKPVGPVMVKASAEGTEVYVMPLVTGDGAGCAAPVIAGSSAKGALRTQTERILATVCAIGVNSTDTGRTRFINQLSRLQLIEALFGAIKKRESDQAGANNRTGRGALGIDDCLATQSIPIAAWAALADEGITTLCSSRDVAQHVAIDRWTGGAADQMLFSAAEPWGLEWNPIVVEVDVNRLLCACNNSERDAQAAIALLVLTLRDMTEGCVPLGYGVNRGYGDIAIGGMTFTTAGSASWPWLEDLAGLKITRTGLSASIDPSAALTLLNGAWKSYLDDFRKSREAEAGGEKQ